MIVGVLSDTHLSPVKRIEEGSSFKELLADDNLREFYNLVEPHFRGADAIIHAGDIIDLSLLKILESLAEVHPVWGNMDPGHVRNGLQEKRTVSLGGFNIGLLHGSGGPDGLPARIRSRFAGERVDCIVFGHSHQPYDRVEDGILMFNPGSALDTRFAKNRTLGILHLEDKIWGEHIYLD